MLNWKTKTRTRKATTKEVAIRLNHAGVLANGEKRYNVVFRFYEEAHKKICPDCEYMMYAVDEQNSRIYFAEADAIKGYKITKTNSHSTTTSKTVCIVVDDTDFWKACIGDYNLLYDRTEKLYYVDHSKKVK